MRKALPTVLVVDDHPFVSEGFARSWRGSARIIGTAETAPSGAAMAMSHHPDVVTMDINLPGSPWDAVRQIIGHTDSKVLFLTGGRTEKLIDAALDSGAHGIVEKGLSGPEIMAAVMIVAKGGEYWGAPWERRLKKIQDGDQVTPGMTEEDLELVKLLANTTRLSEMANLMGVSSRTARERLAATRARYGVETNIQLVALAAVDQYAVL